MGCPAKFPEASTGRRPAVSAIRATDGGGSGTPPRRDAMFAGTRAVALGRSQDLEFIHSIGIVWPVGDRGFGSTVSVSIFHVEQEGL